MSTTHLLMCPMLSACLRPLKQRQWAQTPLRKMKTRRKTRTWPWSSRPQSTTPVWKKRKLKRWWTGENTSPTRSLPALFYFHLFVFISRPFSFLCLCYFAPFFLFNHLSSLRWQVVLLLCMVSGMALHTKPVCVCPSLLTVPRLAEHLSHAHGGACF